MFLCEAQYSYFCYIAIFYYHYSNANTHPSSYICRFWILFFGCTQHTFQKINYCIGHKGVLLSFFFFFDVVSGELTSTGKRFELRVKGQSDRHYPLRTPSKKPLQWVQISRSVFDVGIETRSRRHRFLSRLSLRLKSNWKLAD